MFETPHRSPRPARRRIPSVSRAQPTPAVGGRQRAQPSPFHMKKYVIERDVPGIGACTLAELRVKAEASNEILARLAPDIQWIQGFVVDDRMFCIYLACDEELIREHSRLSGIPFTRIHEVRAVIDPSIVAPVAHA